MTGSYDLVIRGGTVFDGSGNDSYAADIAIRDGVIVELGLVDASRAREVLDADGLIVTPGFVDIHTHYDGQVTWEDRLSPSSNHGVTTVVTGNCGVGFAPCHAQDRGTLVELMAGVEDIPEVVMADGLQWNWRSFPEYLEAVDARRHDCDIATMIPHSALRVFVMRERAIAREPATASDIREMAVLTREAMAAGAIGFGTSRALQQKSIKGQPIPTVRAAEEELKGILEAVAEYGGVFQALSDFDGFNDVTSEFGMLERLVRETGCPLSFTLNQKHSDPEGWRQLLTLTEAANGAGVRIKAQVIGRPSGLLLGHELSSNPFTNCQSYSSLTGLSFGDRITELRRPERRAQILSEFRATQCKDGGTGYNLSRVFELGDPPDYEQPPEQSIVAKAARMGVPPEALAYDRLLEDGGRRILLNAAQNYAHFSLDPAFEMMRHKDSVLGLGDGGAHYGLICDASYPTTMIAHWTRDRTRGPKLTLPWVVKALTSDTAATVGLLDRGRIACGYRADLNVIDYKNLKLRAPQAVFDLPSGGRRVIQHASGYVATVVAGEVSYRNGEPTGALPGRVVRGTRTAPGGHHSSGARC